MNWVVKLHSRKCSLVGSRYVRPDFSLGWLGENTEEERCQVYNPTVAGACISQTNNTAHVFRERNAVWTYSAILKRDVRKLCLVLHILRGENFD